MSEPFYILLTALLGATFFRQDTTDRMIVAFIFVMPIILFDLYKNIAGISGNMYYIVGAFLDLIVINILARVDSPSHLTDQLLIVSAISIILNMIGWAIYVTYAPDTVYRLMYIALYGYALIVLLKGEPKHDRRAENNTWATAVRRYAGTGYFNNNNKPEAKQ